MAFYLEKEKSVLENFDKLGDRVSISYQGQKFHPTKCGGVLTLVFTSFLTLYFLNQSYILITKQDDEYF